LLTFNITLCRYIHDKVSEVREDFSWSEFDFNNYHRFITMALNNSEINVVVPKSLNYDGKDKKLAREIAEERDKYFEETYYSNESVFDGRKIKTKYDTILVDEIQDYKPEWIKILRANFLEDGGEMILFGDEKQNIYGRALDGERRSKVVEGFGRWNKLTKSFRYKESSPIIPLVSEFQKEFLLKTYELDSDESFQLSLTAVGIHAYGFYEYGMIDNLASQIIQLAKSNKIHPNDISIISSQEHLLQRLDHEIRTSEHHRERTLSTFPALEVTDHPKYSKKYNQISASKKYGFNLNSGVMKLSSTHSFKGYESPFIFLIVNEGDSPEIVFTGLTRAKENIVVYMQKNCEFFNFFHKHLADVQTVLTS
jgi:superfamily I DNA/RNA helicase